MSNGAESAFPVDPRGVRDAYAHGCEGLSKRELFAAMAMQGLLAAGKTGLATVNGVPFSDAATWAVSHADALIAELEREV